MIYEMLGRSLYAFLKKNRFQGRIKLKLLNGVILGYLINDIQNILKQILAIVGEMHSVGLTHTDLKPENILFTTRKYKTLNLGRKLMSNKIKTCHKITFIYKETRIKSRN